jgi:hypothetical protein
MVRRSTRLYENLSKQIEVLGEDLDWYCSRLKRLDRKLAKMKDKQINREGIVYESTSSEF